MAVTISRKRFIYNRDAGHCHYCAVLCLPFVPGKQVLHPCAASVDHVKERVSGGRDDSSNLVLACANCNKMRGCIPYELFMGEQLWLQPQRCNKINRLYSIGAQFAPEAVYVLEMYYDDGVTPARVQNWAVLNSQEAVYKYMRKQFPSATKREDLGEYISYSFDSYDPLHDVSFVAVRWDVQDGT